MGECASDATRAGDAPTLLSVQLSHVSAGEISRAAELLWEESREGRAALPAAATGNRETHTYEIGALYRPPNLAVRLMLGDDIHRNTSC